MNNKISEYPRELIKSLIRALDKLDAGSDTEYNYMLEKSSKLSEWIKTDLPYNIYGNCPECNKALTENDQHGHDCEVN